MIMKDGQEDIEKRKMFFILGTKE